MWEYCLSVIVTVMFVSACVPLFSEDNTRTKISHGKVSVTSFNDKAADELFMVLLRVCITLCVLFGGG